MGPITPTAPQSETRTPEPARCGASSLPRPPCRAGKLEGGPRKERRPSQGLPSPLLPSREAPPGQPSSNVRLTRVLRRPLPGRPPIISAKHWRGLGLLPTRALTTIRNQEKEAATAATAPVRGSENTDRPLAAGGRPSALTPSQQRRAHLQGLPHGPRQRGQRWPVAAPSPSPLFFSWPRRREASRPGRRKTAPQLSPRAPRLPHPPLPAAATAPSGVSAVAAGVWGVAGGRGGAGLRREPAPPLGRGRGGRVQVRRPRLLSPLRLPKELAAWGACTCRAVLDLKHFVSTRVLALLYSHTTTVNRSVSMHYRICV